MSDKATPQRANDSKPIGKPDGTSKTSKTDASKEDELRQQTSTGHQIEGDETVDESEL